MYIVYLVRSQPHSSHRPILRPTAALLILTLLLATHHLRLNPHPTSAPASLYRVHRTPPARGDLVVTCLPEHLGRFGRARGYLDFGPCPGKARPVGKLLLAQPGTG